MIAEDSEARVRTTASAPPERKCARPQPFHREYAQHVVLAAVRKLAGMKKYGNTSTASPTYLPKLAKRYDLLDRLSEAQFARAMFALIKDGALVMSAVGTYRNRTPREGLVLP